MIPRSRGVSFPELLIAMLLISAIGLLLINFVNGMSKEIGFTGEHFTAILLTQKVFEDCSREVSVNPFGFKALGCESGKQGPTPVVDGQSVFFETMEDRLAPWGAIDPATDGNLDRTFLPLYDQVKDFRLGIENGRVPVPGGADSKNNLFQTDIGLDWKTRTGKGAYAIRSQFPAPLATSKKVPTLDVSDADVEREICFSLFLEPVTPLNQLIQRFGGDRDTLLALGKMKVICRLFLESEFLLGADERIAKKLAEAGGAGSGVYDKAAFDRSLAIASDSYEVARIAFQFIHHLKPEVEKALSSFDEAHLGPDLWKNKHKVLGALERPDRLVKVFSTHLALAKKHMEILLEEKMSPFQESKRQFALLLKVMDIEKILAFAPPKILPKAQFDSFHRHLEEVSKTRNRVLFRYSRQERELGGDEAKLAESYPCLKTVTDGFSFVPTLGNFLQSNSTPSP